MSAHEMISCGLCSVVYFGLCASPAIALHQLKPLKKTVPRSVIAIYSTLDVELGSLLSVIYGASP